MWSVPRGCDYSGETGGRRKQQETERGDITSAGLSHTDQEGEKEDLEVWATAKMRVLIRDPDVYVIYH